MSTVDTEEQARKRLARAGYKQSHDAKNLRGIRAKLKQKKRLAQKIQIRKQAKALEELNVMNADDSLPSDSVPHYVLDRNDPSVANALLLSIKQRRNETDARSQVPLPKVRGNSEEEMLKVVTTGKKRTNRIRSTLASEF
ncbi:Ribosome biogenesis protein [Colletotrichum tropicale]|nr:Ribosome biogenesis protein [Colletotrichum tropicale]